MQSFVGIKNFLMENVKVQNLKNIRGETIMSPRTSIYCEQQQPNCSHMVMRMIAATHAIPALFILSWGRLLETWLVLTVG